MTTEMIPGESWESVTRDLDQLYKRIEKLRDGSAMAQTMVSLEQRQKRLEEWLMAVEDRLDKMPELLVKTLKEHMGRST